MVSSSTLRYACVSSALLLHVAASAKKRKRESYRKGTPNRRRVRRSVSDVYHSIGDYYFRRAYRMSYSSFAKLHDRLKPFIDLAIQRKRARKLARSARGGNNNPSPPNGKIDSSVRLAIALRYFAGGAFYDVAPLYDVGFTDCFYSIWYVVEAINACPDMVIEFPSDHSVQKEIAAGFESKSTAGFKNCVGAVDGILIWTHRPYEKDAKAADCDAGKFLCARKHKFGLNCQAVCNAFGRILDISISYPGSTSDLLAFAASDLYSDIEKKENFLAEGLCLFGDNAYVNTHFMATPYPNVSGGPEDWYNFYHSQLRIRIECCFGILVQRWGILRSAMPRGISIGKTIRLVIALAKLHNYCIDEKEALLEADDADELYIRGNLGGTVRLDNIVTDVAGTREMVPTALLGGGHHRVDHASVRQRATQDNINILPRERMRQIVADKDLRRPVPRPRRH